MQEYLSQVVAKKYLAKDIVELSVKPVKPRAIKFRAGQFVFFRIGDAWKAYSIASPPADRHRLKFCIKLEPGGKGSEFIKNLKSGDPLEFSGPEGFFYASGLRGDYYFLASGIGVAPFASIIPDLLAKKFAGRAVLIHRDRSENGLPYAGLFRNLAAKNPAFRYVPISKKHQNLTDCLAGLGINLPKSWFYVCGGKEAVDGISQALLKMGVPEERIRTETFLYSDRRAV